MLTSQSFCCVNARHTHDTHSHTPCSGFHVYYFSMYNVNFPGIAAAVCQLLTILLLFGPDTTPASPGAAPSTIHVTSPSAAEPQHTPPWHTAKPRQWLQKWHEGMNNYSSIKYSLIWCFGDDDGQCWVRSEIHESQKTQHISKSCSNVLWSVILSETSPRTLPTSTTCSRWPPLPQVSSC